MFQYSDDPDFPSPEQARVDVTADCDLTARVQIDNLSPGRRYYCRCVQAMSTVRGLGERAGPAYDRAVVALYGRLVMHPPPMSPPTPLNHHIPPLHADP